MIFDTAIGNPPYMEESRGANESDTPVYHLFYESAIKVANKVEFITPARFLFEAGGTPSEWNKKMLNDEHFKVLEYKEDASTVFSNTDIKGGVVISYHDDSRQFGAIKIFTKYEELNTILKKVSALSEKSLSEVISNRGLYRYSDTAYKEEPEELKKTADPRIAPSSFERMPKIFTKDIPDDSYEYIQILGRLDNNRVYRWIRKDFVKDVENLNLWKTVVPNASGTGVFGEPMAPPLIIKPGTGFTETYISIGECNSEAEATAVFKYVKTKFARTMLSLLKVTQNNAKPAWREVPLQDFTSTSDIDWSKSIEEIDQQLYGKYGLSDEEIAFIETHVKEME